MSKRVMRFIFLLLVALFFFSLVSAEESPPSPTEKTSLLDKIPKLDLKKFGGQTLEEIFKNSTMKTLTKRSALELTLIEQGANRTQILDLALQYNVINQTEYASYINDTGLYSYIITKSKSYFFKATGVISPPLEKANDWVDKKMGWLIGSRDSTGELIWSKDYYKEHLIFMGALTAWLVIFFLIKLFLLRKEPLRDSQGFLEIGSFFIGIKDLLIVWAIYFAAASLPLLNRILQIITLDFGTPFLIRTLLVAFVLSFISILIKTVNQHRRRTEAYKKAIKKQFAVEAELARAS